jgi:hypothetical protein
LGRQVSAAIAKARRLHRPALDITQTFSHNECAYILMRQTNAFCQYRIFSLFIAAKIRKTPIDSNGKLPLQQIMNAHT